MRSSELVIVEKRDAVVRISLNRPDSRNALNTQLRTELRAALGAAGEDPEVRAVLLTGEGESFCAGADIYELERRRALDSAWADDRLDDAVESLSKPVVVELRGYTLGGGMELSLACTARLAADDLQWGFPEIRLGIFPALGATQRLPRIVGEGRALDLILTGRRASADEALACGVVTTVAPAAEIRDRSWEYTERIGKLPPVALRVATEAVRKSFDLSRRDGIDYERRLFGLVCGTDDKQEGAQAWIERRKPEFTGS